MKLNKLIIYLSATVALVFIGCSKVTKDDLVKLSEKDQSLLPLGPNFPSLYENIFGKSTTCKNCHQPGGSSVVKLDFSNIDNAYNDLINRGLENPRSPSTCQTVRRVVPGNAKNSYLAGTLFPDYNTNNFAGVANCQPDVVHFSQTNLTPVQKDAIIGWIQAGASR